MKDETHKHSPGELVQLACDKSQPSLHIALMVI